ncbi:hypothetical protein IVB18_50485 (plasmid) [Bradyrhizobium sp. 186]|uniref:LPD7 domain-containing protein n=1 Tax=Bradyrhizobium sp. 186 TaxID=2782654 RepID=UPI002001BF59|nr:LPD7 domain-containing protein [Bradyrhizobium sp. 186]UPK40853.1 hypothetical protein IVB18_50485 [Bradyrhizobium sp. 186]
MNDTRDGSEDFSLKRGERRARDPSTDKPGQDSAARSAPIDNLLSATVDDKALPDRIRRKYYVVANETGKHGPDGEAHLYADERGEYLAFKMTGDRLITRLAAAEVIRDMVSVAQHRQWESIQVRGSVEFRREAWREAGARGIEVQGYQPTELDRQALSDRQDVWNRAQTRTHEVKVRPASDRDVLAERPDYDKGVAGHLVDVGRAPYRNQKGAEPSTYVAIELDNGRRHQVWGVGLEKATANSNAKPGDRILVRRDGVEQVTKEIKVIDAVNGQTRTERRQVPRNRWRVTAEKFRTADRQTAARDVDLVAAQSQMVNIERVLERAFPNDERARHSITEAAREHIARHLEKGRSFARATVVEPVRDRQQSEGDKELRLAQSGERVRMQERER